MSKEIKKEIEKEKIGMDELLLSVQPLGKKLRPLAVDLFCFIAVTVFCLLLRIVLLPIASNDYNQFLQGWFETLKANGGIMGIGLSIGDYTPPYFYILALLTYIPLDPLVLIKLVSCLFDFICAFFIMKLIFEETRKYPLALAAYTLALISPTILLNSAAWAQCDIIFTLFLVLSLRATMREKPFWAMLWFGVSFCFKLQAIFFLPFLILMFLKQKIKLRYFLLIPSCYIICILPALIAGRPFGELLTIYFSQSGQYSRLSLNAPNFYLLFGANNEALDTHATLASAAILICAVILGLCLYLLYRQSFVLTKPLMVTLALFFVILMPFFLPHMHERYFFTADVFAIIYLFLRPKRWYVFIMVTASSFLCYMPFLFGITPVPLNYAVLLMAASLTIVALDAISQIIPQVKRKGVIHAG